ncbi:hypothetical protein CERSUDRAFT_100751 [Gelatoporia subvermispora B]|uniref:F-box domain-containing protein n=1 Tax=Ceriporiopsis subvermispora (strain B) TaxID=914234 RepID=M2QWY2_CERS8|nr:hypothetical protein CERSUDRAFT_100751 [Gelatoporia subvermispora B]
MNYLIPRPRLPPELTDRMIDFLHDDIPTLKTCALVCRAWVPASRMYTFETVYTQKGRQLKSLPGLLQESPTLGANIKKISVDVYQREHGPIFASIAKLLSHVRALELCWNLGYPLVPEDVASFKNVTKLALTMMEPPKSDYAQLAHVILEFRQVKHLQLMTMDRWVEDSAIAELAAALATLPLKRLNVKTWNEVIGRCVQIEPLRGLTSLLYAPVDVGTPPLLSTFTAGVSHLEEIMVVINQEPTRNDFRDMLQACPASLKILRIEGTPGSLHRLAKIIAEMTSLDFPVVNVHFTCICHRWNPRESLELSSFASLLEKDWPRIPHKNLKLVYDQLREPSHHGMPRSGRERDYAYEGEALQVFHDAIDRGDVSLVFVPAWQNARTTTFLED